MRGISFCAASFVLAGLAQTSAGAQILPFNLQTETYRDKEGEVMAFALRLEQPFLAEEFEKSNYLRLSSLDRSSYLIYPKETRFEQKHAELYGRLRGSGKAKLRLSYEVVSENLDGSRKVDVRQTEFEVGIPAEETGPESIYREWARKQNEHFNALLGYYPDETFFQYVLLQSRDRYGVEPPPLRGPPPGTEETERDLYYTFSGGLNLQRSLQRQTLQGGPGVGDLTVHISQLGAPSFRSHPYEELLKRKREEKGVAPEVHAVSKLVPADQYFIHFNSVSAAEELMEVCTHWGDSLLRLLTVGAREHHLREKFEDQLCVRLDSLAGLFSEGAVAELAVTGADLFVAEGSDVTLIFHVRKPEVFETAANSWLEEVKGRHDGLREHSFNYRGHQISARYTLDRRVSSFVVKTGEYVVFSNSHRVLSTVVDTAIGQAPNLHDSLDYRYVTTILPPSNDRRAGYLFLSEAFLKRLVGPAFKISEKRRLQCFNNLVMLNNASLFYRLENGASPASLTDLVEGSFVDPSRMICPHGGAYAFDVEQDTCTCSLHNRIKYLTPNVELEVLKVSTAERDEYSRYKQRYEGFWKRVFNPVGARITIAPTIKAELAVLPFSNSSLYEDFRGVFDDIPRPLDTSGIASTAVISALLVPGREKVAAFLRELPGVTEVLDADPTLTDLSWIGDTISLHFCDDDTVLEIDPILLRPLNLLGNVPVLQQTLIATAIYATSLPVYASVEIEDAGKARRLLDHLAAKIFLKGEDLGGLRTALDSYRLPDYEDHEVYVVSYQLYAIKVRLFLSLVEDRLVAATRIETLRDVIDASSAVAEADPLPGHLLLRVNHRALDRLKSEIEIYWAEKARKACHRNIMPIYNLVTLYEISMDDVDRLADAKYGVTLFCPDGGEYRYDPGPDQVRCSVHGHRQEARQDLEIEGRSSFSRYLRSIEEIVLSVRFTDEGGIATLQIERGEEEEGR